MQIVDWVFGHAPDASDERMVARRAIPRTCWWKGVSDLIQEKSVQKVRQEVLNGQRIVRIKYISLLNNVFKLQRGGPKWHLGTMRWNLRSKP